MPDIVNMDYEEIYELSEALEEILEMERRYGLMELDGDALTGLLRACYDRLTHEDEADKAALNREYERSVL